MKCAHCLTKECNTGKDCLNNSSKYKEIYKNKYPKIMKISAEIAREAHNKLNRLQEIILYSKKMGYKKIGIAFCITLKEEAEIASKILEKDFDVYSVCCKIGGIDKEEMGLVTKIPGKKEVCCNPNSQADVLNNLNTDLNIILGLCIGHDIIFQKQSKVPTTVLIVKDRLNKNIAFLKPKIN